MGFAGMAGLSACAGHPADVDAGNSTSYYLTHAAHNYNPPGPPGDPWGPYVRIAASRFDVPEAWVRRIMRVESGGHEYIDGQLTVSSAGAMGLMQLEPGTYNEMAARYDLGSDPFNPYDNIMAGTAYIHEMYEIYGAPGFAAAYDAGPGRLDGFLNGGRTLPRETVAYVAMVAPAVQGNYPAHRSAADQLALNTLPLGVSTGLLPRGFAADGPAYVEPAYRGPLPVPAPSRAPVELAATAPVTRPDYVPAPVALPLERTALVEPPAPPPALPVIRPHTYSETHFSLVPSAMADTPSPRAQEASYRVAPGHTGWAVQVGAYTSAESARDALGIAQLSASNMLRHGRATVEVMRGEGRVKYRARITGLAHDEAQAACERLQGGPTGCVLLSPEAQS
jgi:cell division septation protein DedD